MAIIAIDQVTVEYYYTELLRQYLEARHAWEEGQFDRLVWKDMKTVFDEFKAHMKEEREDIRLMCAITGEGEPRENAHDADKVVCEYILKALHYQYGHLLGQQHTDMNARDVAGRELTACMRSIMGAMYMKEVYDKKCIRTEGLQYAKEAWEPLRTTFHSGSSVSRCNIINWDNMSMGKTMVGAKVRDWLGEEGKILHSIWADVTKENCTGRGSVHGQEQSSSGGENIKTALDEEVDKVVEEQEKTAQRAKDKVINEHKGLTEIAAAAGAGTGTHATADGPGGTKPEGAGRSAAAKPATTATTPEDKKKHAAPSAPSSAGDSVSRTDPTPGAQDARGAASGSGQQPQAPASPAVPARPPPPPPPEEPPKEPPAPGGTGTQGPGPGQQPPVSPPSSVGTVTDKTKEEPAGKKSTCTKTVTVSQVAAAGRGQSAETIQEDLRGHGSTMISISVPDSSSECSDKGKGTENDSSSKGGQGVQSQDPPPGGEVKEEKGKETQAQEPVARAGSDDPIEPANPKSSENSAGPVRGEGEIHPTTTTGSREKNMDEWDTKVYSTPLWGIGEGFSGDGKEFGHVPNSANLWGIGDLPRKKYKDFTLNYPPNELNIKDVSGAFVPPTTIPGSSSSSNTGQGPGDVAQAVPDLTHAVLSATAPVLFFLSAVTVAFLGYSFWNALLVCSQKQL
ncbi:hypothetical protein AK88_02095 [Plasmodium fragile]|uniref:Schizont-infected cell agglutination extracellular alpha domain-containing protein n=1 Tax=Plasmodium fragile TaxID=5857 RepID=A0A0D9QMP9_PLAFR|nr:uncharacterized protein AK88_02095 [Plasmodium fragile]KJP88314.1 hypothetical protein AK88_02095 [Plasmodium fragile]